MDFDKKRCLAPNAEAVQNFRVGTPLAAQNSPISNAMSPRFLSVRGAPAFFDRSIRANNQGRQFC